MAHIVFSVLSVLVFLTVQILLSVEARRASKTTTPPSPMYNDLYDENDLYHYFDFKKAAKPRDCQDLWDAGFRDPGVFTIYPNRANMSYKASVHCAHTPTDTATVIQRRQSSALSFYQNWNSYKYGFGSPQADYWTGLDTIHYLTYGGNMKLSLALRDWNGALYYMYYNTFIVANETYSYRLSIGYPSGSLVDDMSFSNGMYFATYDRPDVNSCAVHQRAGWWYNYCSYALLNGIYYYGGNYQPTSGYYDGIYWKDWHGFAYSMEYVSMALVRK